MDAAIKQSGLGYPYKYNAGFLRQVGSGWVNLSDGLLEVLSQVFGDYINADGTPRNGH
jgi:hypothetical protein